jgi:hypothetical protein
MDSNAAGPPEALYANHFEIGYNEMEFLLDFAQAYSDSGRPTPFVRIITTPPYALALLRLLSESIQSYEIAHGEIPEIAERNEP